MQNDIKNELSVNFLEYAVAVNTDRAIPDAKSGLKPVARRILWSALEEGRLSSKPHVKAARIVGDVMGKYHPHGDSSIYGALVRLSQNWVMRYPLIDWHGSNGNIAGDGPAASRYTEARLAKIAEDGLLKNMKKNNVDYTSNYDETLEEPITLPALFPNLLCNPNEGIGVALACKWASHNLREVAQAIYDYIDGKEPMLPGPDFPTGGIIINKDDIPAIMRTGHGSVKVRGKYKIDKNKIIFYEIPYGTTIEGILAEIGKVCDEKEIEGIIDAHDESNKKGIRIVITCGKDASPEAIVLKLFTKTSLQSVFSYNQIALVDKVPTELNLKQCIQIYVEHNENCIVREAMFDINKATERLHIIVGLIKALDIIDDIIAMIKASSNAQAAKDTLQNKWGFSEQQAKAILDMKLSRLSKLEKEELEKEKKELEALLIILYEICKNPRQELVKRLKDLVSKYGDERRTELIQIADATKEEKIVAQVIPTDVVVVTTQSGLIKKIPVSSFKVQRRAGKGIKSTDDVIMSTIKTNTVDYMMFFTDGGKMYRTIVDNIPDGTNTSKGVNIRELVKIDPTENIIAVTSLHRKTTPKFIIFITKRGLIKKSFLTEYQGVKRNSGIQAIKIKDDDSLASVIFQDDEDIILISKNGMCIRFNTKNIGAIGRLTSGIKGITIDDTDEIIAALPIHKITDKLTIITSTGIGKKIDLKEIPIQAKGGKGVKIQTANQDIIGATLVSDEDNILICGDKTSICISTTDIPTQGKNSIGSILIKDNKVISIAKL